MRRVIDWRPIPRIDLAAFARRELELRERQWPAAVEAGRMTQRDADDDILAWRALSELLELGATNIDRIWTEIIAAIDLARDRRRAALDEAVAMSSPKVEGFAERLFLLTALAAFARDQRARSHVPRLAELPHRKLAA